MTEYDLIYATLIGQSYQERLFSDLDLYKKEGRETLRKCPFCNKAGKFSYSSQRPLWKCWSCNESGNWSTYLQKTGVATSSKEAFHILAKEAGYPISEEAERKYESYAKRADILETVEAFCIAALSGSEEERYLLGRGYSPEAIQGMRLGSYRDREGLKAELRGKGFTEEDIRASGVLTPGFGETHTIAFLWRGGGGTAAGLVTRSTLSREELESLDTPKYKYSAGMKTGESLLGLETLKTDAAVLVEGVLDTLYLNSLGLLRRVLSPGGKQLTPGHIEALRAAGVKRLLLSLDMDEPGQKAIEKNIQLLRDADIRPFVVALPAGYKDPDELVREKGLGAFEAALSDPQEWPFWLASRIVSKHESTALGQEKALREALETLSGIVDPLDRRRYEEVLREELQLSEQDVSLRKAELEAEAAERAREGKALALLEKLRELSQEKDFSGFEEVAAKGLESLRQARGVRPPEPYLGEDFLREIVTYTGGLETGYEDLDTYIRIPQGALTFIAGRPSHGKTTVMMNMCLRLIETHPEERFYFFSYEESKANILLKMLIMLAGVELHNTQNLPAYISYLRDSRGKTKQIEEALEKLSELLKSGRLTVSDRLDTAEDLSSIIGQLCRRREPGEAPGAFFVDYIQKIPLRTPAAGGQRYLDIKKVSELLLEQAIRNNVPIILGAQLNRQSKDEGERPVRLEHLRESGDIEQDANLVLGLYNKSVTDMEEQERIPEREVPLEFHVLKNRNGPTGRKITLLLDRPILKLKKKAGGPGLR